MSSITLVRGDRIDPPGPPKFNSKHWRKVDLWFIFFLIFVTIFGIVTLPGVVLSRDNDDDDTRWLWRFAFSVMLFLSIFCLFMASFKIVGAKDIGVPVTFGRPDGSVMHNGWNWKNPATDVHTFDGALQTERFSSDNNDDGDPIPVRLFIGSVAKVNLSFQWRLENDDNVKQIYLNYRDPDKINQNLVKRGLQQALNESFSTYNPYAALIAAQTNTGATNTPGTQQVSTTFEEVQKNALQKLKDEFNKNGVQAVSLTIASIEYDGKTQGNLDALGNAITQTQIALQNEKTATAQAAANKTLNDSTASPATIQQLCIQGTIKAVEDGKGFPAGWNCFQSNNSIIPAK